MEINFQEKELPSSWFSREAMNFLSKEGAKHRDLACNSKTIPLEQFGYPKDTQFNLKYKAFHYGVGTLLAIPLINLITITALRLLGILKYIANVEAPKEPDQEPNLQEEMPVTPEEPNPLAPNDEGLPLPLKGIIVQYLQGDVAALEKIKHADKPMWAQAVEKAKTVIQKNVEEGIQLVRNLFKDAMMVTTIAPGATLSVTLWIDENGSVKAINTTSIGIKWFYPEKDRKKVGSLRGLYGCELLVRITHSFEETDVIILDESFESSNPENIQEIEKLYLNEFQVLAKQAWIMAKKKEANVNEGSLSDLEKEYRRFLARSFVKPWSMEFINAATRTELLLVDE